MIEESKLVQLIAQQIKIENEYSKRLSDLRNRVGIAAARLILLEMYQDTEKRAAILAEMLDIIRGNPKVTSLWDHTLEEYLDETLVKKEFEEQVKKETSNLASLKKEIWHSRDKGLKFLCRNMEEDEKKHDRMIRTIAKNLYKADK